MIRLVCICGKHLRARDEASLRHAVCPSCGCPVGKGPANNGESAGGQKPLTMKVRALKGMGCVVVPLWNEGEGRKKEVPRYKVVTIEETTQPSADTNHPESVTSAPARPPHKKRRHARPRSKELNTSLNETLLLPLHCWRSVVSLAFLLGFSIIIARVSLANTPSGFLWLHFLLELMAPLCSAAYCCGCWLVVFTTTLRGRDSAVLWGGQDRREAFVHMLRGLLCFIAGPAIILGVAYYFWLNCGDLAPVDMLILAELIVAALLVWLFAQTAVAADNSIAGLTPAGIAHLFQRLGWRNSIIAVTSVTVAALLIIGSAAYSTVTMSPSDGSWLMLLMVSCVGSQVFLCLFSRWIGVQCFLGKQAGHASPQFSANQPSTNKT